MSTALTFQAGDEPYTVTNPSAPSIYAAFHYASNLYHWCFDIMPALIVLREFMPDQLRKPVDVLDPLPRPVSYWLGKLGCIPNRVSSPHEQPNQVVVSWPTRYSSLPSPYAIRWFRQWRLQGPATNLLVQRAGHGRGPTQSRNLENRDAILAHFASKGCPLQLVYLEDFPVEEQIRLFSNAEVVIAVHGAGLTNINFCSPGSRVVEIRSPLFWNQSYQAMSNHLPIHYRLLTATERHGSKHLYEHCLWIEPEAVWSAVNP